MKNGERGGSGRDFKNCTTERWELRRFEALDRKREFEWKFQEENSICFLK